MNTPTPGEDPPKIIIDEDWKQQAQAEKQRLEQARVGARPAASEEPASAKPDSEKPDSERAAGEKSTGDQPAARTAPPQRRPRAAPPAPSLAMLVTSIATQAMFALGVALDPAHPERTEPDFDQARHLIDTLQMLQDKTAGNRSAEEDAVLSELLHEARMAFVAMQTPPPGGAAAGDFTLPA